MSSLKTNHLLGLLCIITGITVMVVVLGNLLLRVIIALMALSLINYGLRLRGLPPLQVLIPLIASRRKFY